jgi:undecaprenyl-diphosphatase
MDPVHVLILALLQGIAELFPVSSLGHTVIIPGLLGWGDLLRSKTFLPLVVTLHLGTAAALLVFFWRDWVNLLRGGVKVLIAGKFTPDVDPLGYGRQLALVVVGTIPAGLVGVLFQKPLESLFSQPIYAAAFLSLNGIVLLTAERLTLAQRSRSGGVVAVGGTMGATALAATELPDTLKRGTIQQSPSRSLDDMSFLQAALVGATQSFALFPGISRSGITMIGGLATGLSYQSAARFSFLLATPIILAAGALEVPTLFTDSTQSVIMAAIGGLVAGISAYLAVRFLMRYFATHRLAPFAYYCFLAGALSFAYFLLQAQHILP